ncbi:MAG TPA: RodZ domain-containing protein [Bryobacteraceae bacterium]|nr:RodZ domain-containing protein [Bryobacteraceae bacterium]
MNSVGQRLRAERERQNRSISDIARETRIAARYLEAIEADNLSILPGDFFYRNWARQYATVLRLPDIEDLEESIEAQAPLRDDLDVLEVLTANYQPVQAVNSRKRVGLHTAAALLIAVCTGCGAVYAFWNQIQLDKPNAVAKMKVPEIAHASGHAAKGVDPPPSPSSGQITLPTNQPVENPTPATSVATQPTTEAVPAQNAAFAEPSPEVQLDVTADALSWISIRSGQTTLFSGTLRPGEQKQLRIAGDVKLFTGNAGGVRVTWNGRDLGSLGTQGQVRVLLISAGQAQVLPSRRGS